MKKLQRVLIMAGGTGGHVFPGLAVAHHFRDKQIDVHWLGTAQGLEAKLVPEAGFPLHQIQITGLRGKGWLGFLLAPFKITQAVWQALRIIQHMKPDVVIGMGGFVSGPGGFASWLLRRPLIIHEQNAIAGTTNKILANFANKILAGFPTAFPVNPKAITVGNPVRIEIEAIPAPSERFVSHTKPLRLLVLGGSLGAKGLNEVVPRAMAKLTSTERPEIFHQTGDKLFEAAKKDYESRGIAVTLAPFVKDMSQVYSWADMVLCRAGALTVAEMCVAGLGAIFIPFPHAVDDHQTANANYLVNEQAALCVQQKDLSDDRLADIVRELSLAPEKRLALAEAAYRLRKVKVVEKIYEICQEVCD